MTPMRPSQILKNAQQDRDGQSRPDFSVSDSAGGEAPSASVSGVSAERTAHTFGRLEIAGATHLYVAGSNGANVCSASDPRATAIVGYSPTHVGSEGLREAAANARRIAAAWNACHDAGLSTEALVSGVVVEMVNALKLAEKEHKRGRIEPGLYAAVKFVLDKIEARS